MSSQVSPQELGDAVLQSVEHGSFPQSEHVASAPVTSTALPQLLDVVGKAREETKNEVRKISRDAASDVDGWIAQARKLQDDIKRSQETAKAIVQEAEAGSEKTARVQDAASKVSFLYSEIAYNESLVQVVERLQDISNLLESAQNAAVQGHVMHALERLEDADGAFVQLGAFGNTRAVGVLKNRAGQLRSAIEKDTTEAWHALIVADSMERKITIRDQIERDPPVRIDAVVDALSKLGLLDGLITRFSRDFDSIIVAPRLNVGPSQVVSAFKMDGNDIQVTDRMGDLNIKATLMDVHAITKHLSARLPPSIAIPLSEKLVPVITSRLISSWLLPAVPTSTDCIHDFQENLSLVLGLAEYFDEVGWKGQERLREWVDKAGEVWLSRQKETGIARVQSLFPRRVKDKKTVERVETQVISKGDAMLAGQEEQDEDWGAEWGDEEQKEERAEGAAQAPDVEEEDMSAWGMDDDEETQEDTHDKPKAEEKTEAAEEEDVEAWGWGDDDDAKPGPQAEALSKPSAPSKANGEPKQSEKEVTLRETYTVTAIPDSLLEIILQVVTDVGTLNSPDLVKSAIAPSSGGLYAIPSLLLAMYRATAATHYSKDIAGNMLIYNDCTRLSDRLRNFLQEQTESDKSSGLPQHLRPSTRLKATLENDIKSIDGFGKRAYGREMESQRTIIRDLLDGAQGFQTCTNAPFAAECDNAIAMTIDRIEEVKRQWQNVLSHSALMQSLGSLVSTALSKFITDVEDLSDIAEDESRKLHGYCVSLSSLSSLFQTEDDSGESRDMTSIYTPNWFKFQYLGEILDSSLADIKYFWTDGELKLEMDAEEVVDLIKALFAESEHRRKAIGDIRRTSLR
ncbi:hypothetical protein BS50DRAFT_535887 [Corynespora cassiicola Philippines]|uniref:ZW10 C-terminal helical domain-containing protein n=1 Tax=Corynespora cassiicola Philippines TaxID=1448308 RepID=A0A2T2N4M3_CORCC|nr:hypothetical protein BS50DRAFT_535887 [Corynespora cassiicola Philippines]